MSVGGILMVVVTALGGAAGLFPVRRSLGPWAYHLLAFPVGLLGWTFVGAVTTLIRIPWSPWVAAAGMASWAAALALLTRRAPSGVRAVPWWSYGLYALGLGVVAVIASWAGLTLVTTDSWSNYEAFGVWIGDTGRIVSNIVANRALILPAAHAAEHAFGGEWTYVLYPVMAMHVIGLLLYALTVHGRRRLRTWVVALVTGALMVSVAPFLANTFYVHSHMVSAMYLLMGLLALRMASSLDPARGDEAAESASPVAGMGGVAVEADTEDEGIAWATAAGLAAGAFALARPDGPAYVLIIHTVAAILLLRGRLRPRAATVYFATAVVVLALPHLAVIAKQGLYDAPGRLSGTAVSAMLAANALFALFSLGLGRSGRVARFLGARVVRIGLVLAAVNGAAVATVFVRFPEQARRAWEMGIANLFEMGAYNRFWYFGFGLVLVGVIAAGLYRRDRWGGYLLYAIVQFFALAFVIHAATHPGRIGWGDSFNRIAFHALPLLFWLFGLLWEAALEEAVGVSPGSARRTAQDATGP